MLISSYTIQRISLSLTVSRLESILHRPPIMETIFSGLRAGNIAAASTYNSSEQKSSIGQQNDDVQPTAIDSLPNELLCYIFVETLETSSTYFGHRLDTDKVVVLSHVCSRWRRVLLCNPSFWNSITVISRPISFSECLI